MARGSINPEEHIGLIWMLSKRAARAYGQTPADWFGEVALAVCKAAKRYKPSKNCRFSTYAYRCVELKMRGVARAEQGQRQYRKRKNGPTEWGWLPTRPMHDREGEAFQIAEPGTVQRREEGPRPFNLAGLLKDLDPVDREICLLLARGKAQSQIAKTLGISRQRVHQRIEQIRVVARVRKKMEAA